MKEDLLIERFFDNELSEVELEQFQQRLETDEAFKKQTALFGEAHDTVHALFFPDEIKEKEQLKSQLFPSTASTRSFAKVIPIHFSQLLKVAAIVLIGLGLVYISSEKSNRVSSVQPKEIAASLVRLDAIDGANNKRGMPYQMTKTKIINAYKAKNYDQVLAQIALLPQDETNSDFFDVQLLKGIALYHLGDFAAAAATLETIVKSNSGQQDAALWWQVAVYWKTDPNMAKSVLQRIIEHKYATSEEAKSLLKKLD